MFSFCRNRGLENNFTKGSTVFMTVYVLALGRPGSGKSTAARYMLERAENLGWNTTRLKDYDMLYKMFQTDIRGRFQPAAYGGFDVVEFSVLDEVLVELQRKALEEVPLEGNDLVIIEFARNDYEEALQRFKRWFLREAYILYVEADVETCIERIHKRISCPDRPDNHFVSDNILRGYYGRDNRSYMREQFCKDFDVDCGHIQVIENDGLQIEFLHKIDQFLTNVMQKVLVPA